jgi:molybdopterin-guanine dinucleotide biosynthesis protein A
LIGDKWPHTGAILAGGQSNRFGSPKQDLVLGGGTNFLQSACNNLREVCREIVVVGSGKSAFHQIPDLRVGHGPLGGIEALLASGIDAEYLVCPVDMPRLTPTMLRRLTGSGECPVTIFEIDGSEEMEPLPARVSSSVLRSISAALDAGRLALHDMWAELGYETVQISSGEGQALINVNTPDDYKKLRETTP